MKTIIIIENSPIAGSKVTVQVDDNQPVAVETSPVANKEQGLEPVFARPTANKTPATVPLGLVPMDHRPTGKMPDSVTQFAKDGFMTTGKRPQVMNILEKPVVARACSVCGDDISNLSPLAKICGKPECKKAKAAAYKQTYLQRLNAQQKPSETSSTDEHDQALERAARTKPCSSCGDDMPLTSMYDKCANCRPQKTHEEKKKACKLCTKLGHSCKRHRNGEVKITKPAATFLPGYEKTPEEIEALRPKAMNLPGESVPSGGVRSAVSPESTFADPWNCLMCREGQALCSLHTKMTADGNHPPRRPGAGGAY